MTTRFCTFLAFIGLALVTLSLSQETSEQATWVFFTDKLCVDDNSAVAASSSSRKILFDHSSKTSLLKANEQVIKHGHFQVSQQAIERRIRNGWYSSSSSSSLRKRGSDYVDDGIDEEDKEVCETYINQVVELTGGHVRTTSRWLNAVSLEVSTDKLNSIIMQSQQSPSSPRLLPFIKSLEPVRSWKNKKVTPTKDEMNHFHQQQQQQQQHILSNVNRRQKGEEYYGHLYPTLKMLNVDSVHWEALMSFQEPRVKNANHNTSSIEP